jgi:excisionase family DNA binding protein
MDHTPDPERLNVDQTCARLKISRATLFRYVAAGRIAARKIGQRTWISESEIQDFYAREDAEAARERAARAKEQRRKRRAG